MDNTKNEAKNELEHLKLQLSAINSLSYFENIKKNPTGSFLLGIYNIVSVLKEHNLHLAVATTKVKTENQIKNLVKVLNSNMCEKNMSYSEEFELFLQQFKEKNYSDGYYKKFAAVLPVDKMNNDLCQIILDRSWVYTISSLATFEYIMTHANIKFNEFALEVNPNAKLLDIDSGIKNCNTLLDIIQGEDIVEIRNAMYETVNIICTFFAEIDAQFYSD